MHLHAYRDPIGNMHFYFVESLKNLLDHAAHNCVAVRFFIFTISLDVPFLSVSRELSLFLTSAQYLRGLPWWLSGKESVCIAGDANSTPGWGRSPGEGNGNPLQYSCLENSMDRGAWQAILPTVSQRVGHD